jgi:hypothetical protein
MRVLNADQETFAMIGDVKSDSHNVVSFFIFKKRLTDAIEFVFQGLKGCLTEAIWRGNLGG